MAVAENLSVAVLFVPDAVESSPSSSRVISTLANLSDILMFVSTL